MRRGAHQTHAIEEFGHLLRRLQALGDELRTALEHYAPPGVFVAPPGCEVHQYNVKRPGRGNQGQPVVRIYHYNKLAARQAIFAPAHEPRAVTVIHLSRDDDPRNLEARAGIVRRNRLRRVANRLRAALHSLQIVG